MPIKRHLNFFVATLGQMNVD